MQFCSKNLNLWKMKRWWVVLVNTVWGSWSAWRWDKARQFVTQNRKSGQGLEVQATPEEGDEGCSRQPLQNQEGGGIEPPESDPDSQELLTWKREQGSVNLIKYLMTLKCEQVILKWEA